MVKKSMFTIIYLISAIFFVGLVLALAGGSLSGDWLTISTNWAGLCNFKLVSMALLSVTLEITNQ